MASLPPTSAVSTAAQLELPLRDVPGSYGWAPVLSAIKARLDFFWFEGETKFWKRLRTDYQSTVFRTYVPPSPPAFRSNPVIMLLDQRSFPILFDTTKVNSLIPIFFSPPPQFVDWFGFVSWESARILSVFFYFFYPTGILLVKNPSIFPLLC